MWPTFSGGRYTPSKKRKILVYFLAAICLILAIALALEIVNIRDGEKVARITVETLVDGYVEVDYEAERITFRSRKPETKGQEITKTLRREESPEIYDETLLLTNKVWLNPSHYTGNYVNPEDVPEDYVLWTIKIVRKNGREDTLKVLKNSPNVYPSMWNRYAQTTNQATGEDTIYELVEWPDYSGA